MKAQASSELNLILEHYDLGDLVWFEQDRRGTVNTSFAIETIKNGQRKRYFLRRYKAGVQIAELLFEHSILNHLTSNGFTIVAGVIPCKDGGTFVNLQEGGQDQNGMYYAIFDFLAGEDSYTWIGPLCSPSEIISAGRVLAGFHFLMYDFVPLGFRSEARILDLLPAIGQWLTECTSKSSGTIFDDFLIENLATIRNNLQRTLRSIKHGLREHCVELVIHCDFHPGNLKFDNGEAVGLFDLDWSKLDYRCFDVALAVYYFFTCWEEERDGALRLTDVELFLKSYQATLSSKVGPGPLTQAELSILPQMISAANLYVLNWTIQDYLHKEVDPVEYLKYLKHACNTILWLENEANLSALTNLVALIPQRIP